MKKKISSSLSVLQPIKTISPTMKNSKQIDLVELQHDSVFFNTTEPEKKIPPTMMSVLNVDTTTIV